MCEFFVSENSIFNFIVFMIVLPILSIGVGLFFFLLVKIKSKEFNEVLEIDPIKPMDSYKS